MGSEAVCLVRFGERVSEGKALLETTELLFRGDFRLKIPFRAITRLAADNGELTVGFSEGTAVFELGANASKWAAKIRNPRGLIDKLGVKAGQRVAVLGVTDADFLEDLRGHNVEVNDNALLPNADLVFYQADEPKALTRLAELRQSLAAKGAIWVISPKGRAAPIKDTDVMAAAREAGLVDTKVVAFSDTHTALKLVVPGAKRKERQRHSLSGKIVSWQALTEPRPGTPAIRRRHASLPCSSGASIVRLSNWRSSRWLFFCTSSCGRTWWTAQTSRSPTPAT
jgi:hypothetical protein